MHRDPRSRARPRGARMAVGGALVFLVLAMAGPRRAHAEGEPPPRPVRVAYSAPAGCPDRAALLTRIFARTKLARAAAPDEAARELVVRVEREGAKLRGRVVTTSATGRSSQRELTSVTCADLVDALAFFIALAIEADATAPAPAPASPSPLPPMPLAPAPTAEPAAPLTLAPPPPRAPRPVPAPVPVPRPSAWWVGGGVGLALVGGVAPGVLPGNRIGITVARRTPPPTASDVLLTPAFFLAGSSTATGGPHDPSGSLALRWQAVAGGVCPVETSLGSAAALRPCAFVEVGVLRGDGVGLVGARRNEAPWAAAGLALHGRAALGWNIDLEVELGAAAPFHHARFLYTTGAIAFETPALGLRSSVGVALRF